MSYSVAVVVPRIVADDARAWERVDELCRQEGPTPMVFQMFLDRLTARYPCICDLPDEEADDGVWTDGPLRNNLGHRVSRSTSARPPRASSRSAARCTWCPRAASAAIAAS